jgi:hypothetical protein
MQDISAKLAERRNVLADFTGTLAAACVNLEGGGAFIVDGQIVLHYLVSDATRSKEVLDIAGLGPATVSDVIILRLKQAVPGQLALLARRFADADVNISVQYSDHDNNLVLVVSSCEAAAAEAVAAAWRTDA